MKPDEIRDFPCCLCPALHEDFKKEVCQTVILLTSSWMREVGLIL